jgi:hypothetical protein
MFTEDRIPECRSSAHPLHTNKRQWMVVIREDREFVVWCCRRCSEITHSYAIQVQVLPPGQERARYMLGRTPPVPTPPRRLGLPSGLRIVKPAEEGGEGGL